MNDGFKLQIMQSGYVEQQSKPEGSDLLLPAGMQLQTQSESPDMTRKEPEMLYPLGINPK
ncbi:hypothetical protein DDZ15_13675 [Rhodohalobacter mucosus]|uniref:Uncharacterized protein n=1 Tax=Rhodohalobacter mucosus TaxID=2079485 RepID=A0A316TTN5_9BACT|nr:hypothetical protein DDZ15_13675 [Rhodohalobacter mucosus]